MGAFGTVQRDESNPKGKTSGRNRVKDERGLAPLVLLRGLRWNCGQVAALLSFEVSVGAPLALKNWLAVDRAKRVIVE